MTGASTLTRPSSPASGGASTATTPDGSGTLRLKYGPATALAPPVTCATLSGQPAYQTHRSIAADTFRAAPGPVILFLSNDNLAGELLRPAFEHFGDPVQDLAAVVGRRPGPAREGLAGRDHGVPGVFA